jgi:hypothetical protein
LASGVILWGLYFALGFRAFAHGIQANKLGTALTIGLPLVACLLIKVKFPSIAGLMPPGSVYLPTATPVSLAWLPGPLLSGLTALLVGRRTQLHCVDDLRRWYGNHRAY